MVLVAWLAACDASPPAAPRHLLVISIDTLRADFLGAYGQALPTSPSLDGFADEAVVFEDAHATSSWTLPSHASLLTGLYPQRHGVTHAERRLDPRLASLAKRLADAGFRTGALVNSVYLQRHFGLDAGFASYTVLPEEPDRRGAAPELTDRALAWLREDPDTRSFLFLHYYDVHSDYASLPRYERLFAPVPGRYDGTTAQLSKLIRRGEPLAPDDLAHLRFLYAAGVRQLDAQLGRLFRELEADGWLDDAVVVVTSDHGEEFQEHGGFLHGRTHYRELTWIPLLLRAPGLAAQRVAPRASLVDVVPTALALLGVPSSDAFDGVDWSAALAGAAAPAERAVFVSCGPGTRSDDMRSVVDGGFKLVFHKTVGWYRLYDLVRDPGEQEDVAASHPDVVRSLLAQVAALDARAVDAPAAPELDPTLRNRLRELGYAE